MGKVGEFSTVESRRLSRRRTWTTLLAAGLLATGCSSDGKGEGGVTTNSPGVGTETNDGGQGGGAQPEGSLECPAVTPDFDDGNLTAKAVAAGEVSTNDFFGLTVAVIEQGSVDSTAWFAQFDENGTADIAIPEQTMDKINNSASTHTITSIARIGDVAPPEETLTPEGMPGATALTALNEEVARVKGIAPEDFAEQIDKFPEQIICGGAFWNGETWNAHRAEGAGLGEKTNNPFASFPDSAPQN